MLDHPLTESTAPQEMFFRGVGVSPGIASGRAYLKASPDDQVEEKDISRDAVPREIARLESALIATRRQIRDLQKDCAPEVASIFDAHLLILDDRPFIENIILGIENRRKNADIILHDAAKGFMQSLAKVKDAYVRERVADVEDVTRRIRQNLIGQNTKFLEDIAPETIIVASDLSPSEVVAINKDLVTGIALDLGSPTAHSAILAGKLGIPAVVGLHNFSAVIRDGDMILIDGSKGVIVVHPTQERIERAKRAIQGRLEITAKLAQLKDQPAETSDGYRIVLSANIEVPQDVEAVLDSGAEGVGLFRSEYFYMSRQGQPSEEEQLAAYRDVAQRLAPAPVIIRTLDFGGDKISPDLAMSRKESNPFMGWRAIRFCLAQPDLFRTQLRAILRASVFGNVKIMYPMISAIDEIVRANEILDQAKKELMEQGHVFNPHIEVGAMIEVPSAAIVADLLAPHVRFFSLGTNDLIQYTLAIDRTNERVAYLYEPTHIAVLRLIKNTIDAGHRQRIWTGICGSIAADPLMIPLLIGLGIDELSMHPAAIPAVKGAIRSISYAEAREAAALALASADTDVIEISQKLTRKIAPEILELVD